jgi:hypothetical protein
MSAALTNGGIVIGGGVGACPTTVTPNATAFAALQQPLNAAGGLWAYSGFGTNVAAAVAANWAANIQAFLTAGFGTNVPAAVEANWAANIQAFLTAGWGANVAGAAETALNNLNGLVSYQNANVGSPPAVVNCTIPDTAPASTNWCVWKFGTGVAQPYFDTLVVTGYATCSSNYPVYEAYDVTTSTAIGSTVTGVNGTATPLAISTGAGSATDQFAIRVTTLGSGCSSSLGTEFFSVSLTYRGG